MATAQVIDFSDYHGSSADDEEKKERRRQEDRSEAHAIREMLLADLATWPAAFQRRLRGFIIERTEHMHSFWGAGLLIKRFYEARAPEEDAERERSGCYCGCRGRNGSVAGAARKLRNEMVRYRTAGTPRKRENRRADVEAAKEDLLERLWLYGWRKVDRRTLEQHATEEKSLELENCERELKRERATARYYRARLKHGRYLRNPNKGERLSRRTRESFRATAERAEEALPSWENRVESLRRLLEAGPSVVVRAYTGCTRQAAGVAHAA